MKKFRILPKGYLALMVTLVVCLFLLASLTRHMAPTIVLSNMLHDFSIDSTYGSLSIETAGDAVNYDTKDIYCLWSLKSQMLSLDIKNQNSRNLYNFRASTYTSGNQVMDYPILLSNVFTEDIISQVMTEILTPSYMRALTVRNKNALIKEMGPYLRRDGKAIKMNLTLMESYDLVKHLVNVLFTDHQAIAFNQMIQDNILESFDAEFVLVSYVDEIRKMLEDYKEDSLIELSFLPVDGHVRIEGNITLNYESCDASEIIHFKIDYN